MWPGLRPTAVPGGIVIHADVFHNAWAENWGLLCPFFRRRNWVSITQYVAWDEAYLAIRTNYWHLVHPHIQSLTAAGMDRKLGEALYPFCGELGPDLTHVAGAEAYTTIQVSS